MRRINYSKVARETGFTVGYVSRIFRGERTPTVKTLRMLAKRLNMNMEKLAIELDKAKDKKNNEKVVI